MLWEACFFCCGCTEESDDNNDDDDERIILPIASDGIVMPLSGESTSTATTNALDLDFIVTALKHLADYRDYEMCSFEKRILSQIDAHIDNLTLNHEIKDTLKAFYRISDAKERRACRDRIEFLLNRYQQTIAVKCSIALGLSTYDGMYAFSSIEPVRTMYDL